MQLANLLLKWCCNTRDVHLLRGVPVRLVAEAARRHDQAIKVACAGVMGFIDLGVIPRDRRLHSVTDADLPPDFVEAYAQVRLDVGVGGHGLRSWAEHADAAYVGQWSLTCKSAVDALASQAQGRVVLHYPVLEHVIGAAAVGGDATMPVVEDVRGAWAR